MSRLDATGGDIADAVERVRVPSYVIDPQGTVRWLNPAAEKLVGDVRGRPFTSVVAPEERRRAKAIFARNLLGPPVGSDNKGVLIDADGERVAVEISAVPLRDGSHVVGVFGQIKDVEEEAPPPPSPAHALLTPRQSEVLQHLEHGRSTEQIAQELRISAETVRNHIRGLLGALDVHSRIEAVALVRGQHHATG